VVAPEYDLAVLSGDVGIGKMEVALGIPAERYGLAGDGEHLSLPVTTQDF